MKIVCSWCRKEGREDVVGEKPPLDDARETHGICVYHRYEVHKRWRASLQEPTTAEGESGSAGVLSQWIGLASFAKKLRP